MDTFKYKVNDGIVDSPEATVTINVYSPTPTGGADNYMTPKNQALTVPTPGVRQNDQYSDSAQTVAGSGPSHGSLSFNSNGSFTYTPTTNYSGSDSFQYKAVNSVTGQESTATTVTIMVMSMLTLDEEPQANSSESSVALENIEPLYQEALRRWHEAGVSSDAIDLRLASVVFIIADIPGSGLAAAMDDGTIVIDTNAAGYGWYVDNSPRNDWEFQLHVAPSERKAIGTSPAVARADLLTAITHEVGHVLGLEHSERVGSHSVMSSTLGLSTRRVPTLYDVAILELLDGWDRRRRN